jgi:hypothetical protein
LLGSPSFQRDISVNDGSFAKYELVLIGKMPNMVHDELQMFWPTYHDVFYKIHIDKLSGVITEESFKIMYKNKMERIKSYSGSLTFEGDRLIINLINCPHPSNCFEADFNGSYNLKNKI